MRYAILTAVSALFWLAISTFGSIAFGEWLRLGLEWDGGAAAMMGMIVWFCMMAVIPGVSVAVYLNERTRVL